MPPRRLVAVVELPPAASVTCENTGIALSGEPVMKLMTIARTMPPRRALVRKLESFAAAPAPRRLRKMTSMAKPRAMTVGHR